MELSLKSVYLCWIERAKDQKKLKMVSKQIASSQDKYESRYNEPLLHSIITLWKSLRTLRRKQEEKACLAAKYLMSWGEGKTNVLMGAVWKAWSQDAQREREARERAELAAKRRQAADVYK